MELMAIIRKLFWFTIRVLLRLRYRVEVIGLDKLKDLKGPTLVMPNHPGYIDPPLVLSHVRLPVSLRPLVYAGTFRNPILYPMMRLADSLEVPDLAEHSRSARDHTLVIIDTLVEGLKRGESFLIYPSGRIQRGNQEVIGAARAAAEILSKFPEANVVLVRTRGIWGSMFSVARTGKLPNLGQRMMATIWLMLGNLLLFAPRRRVTMELKLIDKTTLPELDREQLNPFLEEWYNRGEPEQPKYVPYHFLFGPRQYAFPDLDMAVKIDLDAIPDETRRAVNEILEEHLGRPLNEQEKDGDTTLDAIGLDSLDRMDLALRIEDRFGFHSDRVAHTVGQLWALAAGQSIGPAEEEVAVPAIWSKAQPTTETTDILADTIAEAIVRRALLHPNDVAVADSLSGALTYRRLLVGAQLMAKRFADLPGDAVGVMLPASVAADLVFFALHLAGKLPVMLNWTTGPANMKHAINTMQIQRVVSSQRFVDRMGVELEDAEFAFLEAIRGDIHKLEAVRTLIGSYLTPGRVLRNLPKQRAEDTAVVLFTSGSENAPKAVPLSHRNLLTNVRSSLRALDLTRQDILMGFLPPFHSFGVMGNVVTPLVTGLRCIHHVDPTDANELVRLLPAYRPTLMITTPTFLGYMFAVAPEGAFDSLRIIMTGAEKCPEATFDRCAEVAPKALLLEGYGITECSPVVAANRVGRVKRGTVGLAIDDVEVCLVHPETGDGVGLDETGMLLVRGPTVFSGYLNYSGPDPFVEAAGKRWYKTGDLVALDDEGFIHFRGRLKRFLKAAGEMISLPALEEPFARLYPPTEDGPQVAVEGVEIPGGGRRIVLFCTQELELREANQILSEAGFRGVMRLDETRRVESIPVLGTGKTDYKVLRQLITDKTS